MQISNCSKIVTNSNSQIKIANFSCGAGETSDLPPIQPSQRSKSSSDVSRQPSSKSREQSIERTSSKEQKAEDVESDDDKPDKVNHNCHISCQYSLTKLTHFSKVDFTCSPTSGLAEPNQKSHFHFEKKLFLVKFKFKWRKWCQNLHQSKANYSKVHSGKSIFFHSWFNQLPTPD